MKKRTLLTRVGDVLEGKGFYIILLLCVAVIGLSGYYLVSATDLSAGPGAPVDGQANVVVTPSPAPTVKPQTTPAPTATPVPQATPASTKRSWPQAKSAYGAASLPAGLTPGFPTASPRRFGCWMWAPAPAFSPSFWPSWATG